MKKSIEISEGVLEALGILIGTNDVKSQDVEDYLRDVLSNESLDLLCRYKFMEQCLGNKPEETDKK